MKIQRNESCPCQSGKKYKKCCAEKENLFLEENDATDQLERDAAKEAHALYLELQKEDASDNILTQAELLAEKYPNNYMVEYLLAHCFIKKNDTKSAVEHLITSIKLYPLFAGALYLLGLVYEDSGAAEKAIDCFEKVIKIEGRYSELAISASKQIEEIHLNLKVLTDSENLCADLLEVVNRCFLEKEYARALEGLEMIQKLDPKFLTAHPEAKNLYDQLIQTKN